MAMDGMREGFRDVLYNVVYVIMCNVMFVEELSIYLNKFRVKIFFYLKKYIRYFSRKEFGRFFRYVIGSFVLVVKCIKVMFYVNELGFLLYFYIYICVVLIDFFDNGYVSFNDFRI